MIPSPIKLIVFTVFSDVTTSVVSTHSLLYFLEEKVREKGLHFCVEFSRDITAVTKEFSDKMNAVHYLDSSSRGHKLLHKWGPNITKPYSSFCPWKY